MHPSQWILPVDTSASKTPASILVTQQNMEGHVKRTGNLRLCPGPLTFHSTMLWALFGTVNLHAHGRFPIDTSILPLCCSNSLNYGFTSQRAILNHGLKTYQTFGSDQRDFCQPAACSSISTILTETLCNCLYLNYLLTICNYSFLVVLNLDTY